MDDLMLSAMIDENTTLRVSPIAPETYQECVDEDTLGGGDGYFLLLTRRSAGASHLEVLAKAKSFDSAEALFNMIVRGSQTQAIA